MERKVKVAVAGATGAVGREILKILEERDFPVGELIPLASERSEGSKVEFRGEEHTVKRLTPDAFAGVEIALFSPGGSVSREFAPHAARAGAVVVDNTSAFRMEPDCPLVVPEVNAGDIELAVKPGGRRIIANPNCSTIQLVVVMKTLHDLAGLRKVVVSTYQSVSRGARQGPRREGPRRHEGARLPDAAPRRARRRHVGGAHPQGPRHREDAGPLRGFGQPPQGSGAERGPDRRGALGEARGPAGQGL